MWGWEHLELKPGTWDLRRSRVPVVPRYSLLSTETVGAAAVLSPSWRDTRGAYEEVIERAVDSLICYWNLL